MPSDKPVTVQTQTIKWLYILALSMVAILTLTGQALVQWSLATLQGDSTTVNIAGRQRMLSQRIPRIILAIDANRRSIQSDEWLDTDNQGIASDLNESFTLWQANHLGLASASRTVGLARENSRPVNELFDRIKPNFLRVQEIAKSVIERVSNPKLDWISAKERDQLLENSDAFLSLMDAIVAQYELEAKQRVNRLMWIERGLLFATLLVLVCEGLFIFSPAIASLNRAFGRLKAVTDQLELAKESAEQANRAKTQFLARVSHELRTPLHAILGMLGLLRQGRLTHGQKQRADLAYDASQTLRHLVDDLLDVSSAESGSPLTLQLERTNVAKVVNDCANLMLQQARRKRLTLYAVSDLPDGELYLVDAYRIRQIVINLIQNAIRYTTKGEIKCRTWLEQDLHALDATGKVWLHISVRDTGCGIAPENLECIFQNFVRINPQDGSNLLGPRLGLGLPITASLVTTMQGTITVESKLNEGSEFTIRIPTVPVRSEIEVVESQERNARKVSNIVLQDVVAKQGMAAIIVDDSKVNRMLMRKYLNRLGIKTCSTNNLSRALRLYKERLPQLVLLDLQIGKQNSLGLIKSIRRQPNGTRPLVFIVTADGHFSSKDCPAELDVAGIFYKPIEFEELRTQLVAVFNLPNQWETSSVADSQSEFDELRAELRRLLTENLPQEIARLENAYDRKDLKTFQLVAHRLRGAAANAGWKELAEAVAKIESQTHQLTEFKRNWL